MTSPAKRSGFFDHIVYPTLIMVVFTAVMTGAIAALDAYTAPQIEANKTTRIESTLLYVFHLHAENLSAADAKKLFDAKIVAQNIGDTPVYVYHEDQKIVAVAFPMSGKGLWGTINGYLALSYDGQKLLGVDFTDHSETPGLGGRIDEAWFKEQFRNLNTSSSAPTAIYKTTSASNVDAITGATLTSNDVLEIINHAIVQNLPRLKEVHL